MVRHVIGWSLRFRLLVIGIAAGVMVLGVLQLHKAPADVLPEFSPAYVEVQTEALGLSAEEVEQLVTVPLEADLLNGTKGATVLRSQSVPGMSSIVLLFEPGTPILEARQLVQEQLTQAHANPNVSQPPQMLQPLSSESRMLMIGLSPEHISPIEASVLARWTIRPRLLGVDGVANVSIFGERSRQLQVLVDPDRLRDEHVTLARVIRTAGNAQLVSPLSFLEASTPGTGGFIDTANQRLQVRHVLPLLTPQHLARVPLEGTGGAAAPKRGGRPARLGDVTRVVEDHQPLIGDAIVHGRTGLLLVVEKLPGADTLKVTRGVQEALDELRPGLTGLRIDASVFRPADFIREARDNLALAAGIGVALLALGLFALLFAWRTAVVCLASFALSLTAAALVLSWTESSINALVFAGLAAAVAVVVDDAVIGAEHIRRRLQERAGGGRAPAAVVVEAAAEMRSPMGYATCVVVLTAIPVLFVEGVLGSFVDPLVRAYLVAIAASLLVALTVTPALALSLPAGARGAAQEPALTRWATARYDGLLARMLGARRIAPAGLLLVALAGAALVPALHGPVIPAFKDRELLVHFDAPAGTSRPEMSRIVARASRDLRGVPGVSDVGGHIGRAITADQVVDVNSSELWVRLDRDADYGAATAAVRRVVAGYPGLRRSVRTYEEQRIRDVGTIDDRQADAAPGRSADLDVLTGHDERPLVVRVFGEDLGVLRRQADRVRRLIAGVDGVERPLVERFVQEPTVAIRVDLDRALRFGIKPGDVRRQAATLLNGIQVGSLFDQQKVFEVVVRATPEVRRSLTDVRQMVIDTPGGGHVRLGRIGDVRIRPAPQVIERDASSRRIDVSADVRGRGLGDVRDELRARLRHTSFPLEYHAEVLGDATGREAGWAQLLVFGIAAALGALLLLQAAFRSWRLAALVLAALPVALVGSELAGVVDGGAFSLGALAGLLAVLAIAARNSVALVCHLDHLQQHEGAAFGPALVRRGAGERLGPVVVTAAVTGMAFLPFLVLGDRAGYEVVRPLAVSVLGGLVTSTLLVLLVVPVLYARFGRAREPDATDELELLHRWAGVDAEDAAVAADGADGAEAVVDSNGAAAAKRAAGAPREGQVGAGVEAEEGR
jgi:Cu/Ag efflux pump CusA